MRRLILAASLIGALAVAAPPPAVAAGPDEECLGSCDRDFDGDGYIEIAIRGWCYIIRCLIP